MDISKKKAWKIFDSTDENKELLKRYNDVWNGTKNEVKAIDGGKESDYEKISWKLNLI